MIKRLPILFIALAVALSCSLGFGAKVSAASPTFYEGTISYNIARRSYLDTVDFNWIAQTYNVPFYSDVGLINCDAWGLPSAFSETSYTRVPMFISVTCPDLAFNGGSLFVSFMVAYFDGNGITNFNISDSRRGHVYRYSAGSLSAAVANGTDLGNPVVVRKLTDSVTKVDKVQPASTGNEVLHVTELNLPNGTNFPKTALFDLTDDKGTLAAYGLEDAYLLGYGDTSDLSYIKSQVFTYRVDVPSGSSNVNNTFYFDLTNLVGGTFRPVGFSNYNLQTNAGIYFIQSALSGSMSNVMYLCPVSCFAVSSSNYSDIEVYLENISQQLSGLSGSSIPQSVLESYAALGSEAREAAHAAASAMAQNYPTYDASAMDIANYVDPTAKAQFKSVVSFLGNRRILPIIGVVFTLVLIGYVFFGKK